mgnify:CR=1 FL=1
MENIQPPYRLSLGTASIVMKGNRGHSGGPILGAMVGSEPGPQSLAVVRGKRKGWG